MAKKIIDEATELAEQASRLKQELRSQGETRGADRVHKADNTAKSVAQEHTARLVMREAIQKALSENWEDSWPPTDDHELFRRMINASNAHVKMLSTDQMQEVIDTHFARVETSDKRLVEDMSLIARTLGIDIFFEGHKLPIQTPEALKEFNKGSAVSGGYTISISAPQLRRITHKLQEHDTPAQAFQALWQERDAIEESQRNALKLDDVEQTLATWQERAAESRSDDGVLAKR
jgi:hypothetical protein